MLSLFHAVPLLLFILLLGVLWHLKRRGWAFNKLVFLSLFLGITFGTLLQLLVPDDALALNWASKGFDLVGSAYLALLKMLVIPLVLTSIIHAILNLGEVVGKVLKILTSRTILMLLSTTAVSSGIGIAVAMWFNVGDGLQLPSSTIVPKHAYTGLVDTLLGMLPSNPVAVMSNGNTVAIVIFAALLGASALTLFRTEQAKVENFKQFITSTFQVVRQLARTIIALTPFGVFALMADITSMQGLSSLLAIANYVLAMFVALLIVLSMHLLLLAFVGINPVHYLKYAYKPLLVAMSTRSSFGTLPVTEETLRRDFQTRQVTASFVPSLGATMGMNGCAGVFPAVLVVMVMTILHQPITWEVIAMVMFINAIASLGISGIPGTAFVAATVTLTAMNLPYAVVGLVQGVDPLVDMGRTAINVNGVMTTALVVDKSIPDTESSPKAPELGA